MSGEHRNIIYNYIYFTRNGRLEELLPVYSDSLIPRPHVIVLISGFVCLCRVRLRHYRFSPFDVRHMLIAHILFNFFSLFKVPAKMPLHIFFFFRYPPPLVLHGHERKHVGCLLLPLIRRYKWSDQWKVRTCPDV